LLDGHSHVIPTNGVDFFAIDHQKWRHEELGLLAALDLREVEWATPALEPPHERVERAGGKLGVSKVPS
jgi:hypothetical protein